MEDRQLQLPFKEFEKSEESKKSAAKQTGIEPQSYDPSMDLAITLATTLSLM